jgi:beta-glucosidase
MTEYTFPRDFLWGTATASYQVEGAAREDGRSESIWDRFARTPGKVYGGENGDVSVDQYHRYREDIKLMQEAGIQAYRFSIAWPRIIPDGRGEVNPKGIAYYRDLARALLDAGIKPTATLYHWDLPQVLQDQGGWAERSTAEAFAAYAEVCFRELGDLITEWITLNEPWCSAYHGYADGCHAPGIRDEEQASRAVHHLNLAHGLALQAFRKGGYFGRIGITWNLATPRPASLRPEDRKAADFATDRDSRMFTGPVSGKGYPEAYLKMAGLKVPVQDGDMELIAGQIDFAGLNYYFETPVVWDEDSRFKYRSVPSWQPVTDMGWPIVPDGLYRLLSWLAGEIPGVPIYITENGCARQDAIAIDSTGRKRVHDHERIDYLRTHLSVAARAIHEGIPLKGYYLWSFIDNFEWAFGYSKRFGIVYCDYASLERIPKDSYYYLRDVIAGYERFQA